NAAFRNGLAKSLFKKDRVSDDLQAIGRPGRRRTILIATRAAALVFVRQIGTITPAQTINLTVEPELIAGKFEAGLFTVLVGFERRMQFPARKDASIG